MDWCRWPAGAACRRGPLRPPRSSVWWPAWRGRRRPGGGGGQEGEGGGRRCEEGEGRCASHVGPTCQVPSASLSASACHVGVLRQIARIWTYLTRLASLKIQKYIFRVAVPIWLSTTSLRPVVHFTLAQIKRCSWDYRSRQQTKRHTCLATVLYTEASTGDMPIQQPKAIYDHEVLLSHIS